MSDYWKKLHSILVFSELAEYLKEHHEFLRVADEPEDANALDHFLIIAYGEYPWSEDGSKVNLQRVRPWLDLLLKPDDAYECKARQEKWILLKDTPLVDSTLLPIYLGLNNTELTLYLAKEVLELPDPELHALIVDLLSLEFRCSSRVGRGPYTTPEDWVECGVSPVGIFEAIIKKLEEEQPEGVRQKQMFGFFINYLLTEDEVVQHVLKHGDPEQKTGFDFVLSAVERSRIPRYIWEHTQIYPKLYVEIMRMLSGRAVHQMVVEAESK